MTIVILCTSTFISLMIEGCLKLFNSFPGISAVLLLEFDTGTEELLPLNTQVTLFELSLPRESIMNIVVIAYIS